ncbi:Eco57I restriction-modification methylase domain-containing protein [Candidatus Poribacteria bacterium]
MDKASLIEWTHSWRKTLVQNTYMMPDDAVRIQKISRDAQRLLCEAIISQMLAERNMPDAGPGIKSPDVGSDIPNSMLTQARRELSEVGLDGLPFEVLSDIYESYLAQKLTLSQTGELEYLPERGLRKGKGIYYTPPYVVQHIVNQTLGRYLWGTESGRAEDNTPARTPEDIRHLRILDPACGSGCFLAYAFDVLAEFYTLHNPCADLDWPWLILEKHLYGVDIDSDAVDMTSTILMLKALGHTGRAPAETPELNIKQGNFLVSTSSASQNLETGRFTMILGNPPYGAKLSTTERKAIKSEYETYRSSDSSSLFVEKAVKMLEDDGILGFIVPKSLSYVVSWQPIRKFLLDECEIVEIADARKAFRGVLLEQMIMVARKRGNPSFPTTVSILRPEYSAVSHSIGRQDLSPERFSIWFSSRRVRAIVDRIQEKSVPLGHLAEIWNGLGLQGQLVFSDKPDSEYHRPCLRGRDIQRYHVRQSIKYIRTADIAKHISLETFHRQKIIVQDIVAHIHSPTPHIKLTATVDRSGDWLNVNTVTNIASSEYPLEYLCGILNSRLISWYTYDFIFNRSIRTMHFRRGYADHIQICRIDTGDHRVHEQLMEHVDQIMALYDKQAADEIVEVDRKIDKLVYQLYGITEEDVSFLRENAGLYTS